MRSVFLILSFFVYTISFSQNWEIEIDAVKATKKETTNKLYNFTKVDTLFSDDTYAQIGFVKSGDQFTLLHGYKNTYDENYLPKDAGYWMSNIGKVDGTYKRLNAFIKAHDPKFGDYSEGYITSSFEKNGDGFTCVSPYGILFFTDIGSISSFRLKSHIMINAVKVPETNKYIFLAVSGLDKEEKYTGQRFCMAVYDADTKMVSPYVQIRNMAYELWKISPLSTKLYITKDNEILCTFGLIDANGYKDPGFGDQYISKLSLKQMLDSNKIEYLWFSKFTKDYVRNINIKEDGTIEGLMIDNGFRRRITSFTADANADTFDEFKESFSFKQTAEGDDQVTPSPIGFFPLKNGRFITVGPGNADYGYGSTAVFCLYDSNLSLIRQFRLKDKFENFPYQQVEQHVRNLKGYFGQYGEGASGFNGVSGRKFGDNATNAVSQHGRNFLDCIYEIIPGDTDNEIFVMTADAILKIDLTKYEECKLRGTIPDYSDGGSDDSYTDDSSSDEDGSITGSSTTKTNSTKTSSTSTSGNTTKEKEFSGSVYFKYDMSGKDRPGEKLYIHSGSNASTVNSTTPGSSATVKCQSGKVYYSFTGNKSDMKEFMEMTVDDCGKTFKYTEFK